MTRLTPIEHKSHLFHRHLDGVKRYVLAFAIVACGVALRALLSPILGPDRYPFVTLFGAVVFCSWYCRVGPSVVATLGGLLYAWYEFLPPVRSFALDDLKIQGGGMVVFAMVAGLIIALGEANRRAQRKARTGSDQLRLAQQAARIGSFEWNIKTGLNRWTPELEEIYGLAAGQFPGTLSAWEELIHPDDKDEAKQRLKYALEHGSLEGEWRVVWPDGSIHWILGRALVLKDEIGMPGRMLGVNIDITERKQAETTNSLLAAVVDSSDDAIISKTLDGIITSWNESAERMFGYSSQEAVGQHISLIIPEDRRDEETGIIERLRRGERIDHFETVRQSKDGTQLQLSLTISPIRNPDGRIVGASKVARDITERKKTELDRQKFIALADRCTEFIGMCDMEFRPFYVNDAALRLVGLDSLEELRSVRVADFFFPEDQAFIANEFIPKVLREGSGEVEIRFRHFKNGSAIWMIYNVFVIRDQAEKPIALGTFSQNITYRKAAEDAVRKSEQRLRALSDSLEQAVQSRTAELEQRHSEVLEQAEQLRELSNRLVKAQDDERRRIARELHDSAGQLIAALGMSLAQFSAYAKQDRVFAQALEDAEELVRHLNSEIRTTSYLLHPPLLDESGLPQAISWYTKGLQERSGIQVQLQVSEEFGRLPSDIELALFRIIQESLTNVHRHSGSKSANIRLAQSDNSVSMQIEDRGKGIPPEKLTSIRAQRAGVGMTGMRERVRQLNGVFDIRSSDSGVTINVTLPALPNSSTEVPDRFHPTKATA